MTKHEIIIGNSSDMHSIPNQSVNLIVTSPPYPMIEMWDQTFGMQDSEITTALERHDGTTAFHKMHDVLNHTWKECDRVLCENGFVCINIGDATRTINGSFQLYSNHTKIIDAFLQMGYHVLPDIHWRKQSNSPNKFMGSGMYPAGAYVTYEHEYILIFRKGGKRLFTSEGKSLRQKSAFFWEERNIWFSDLWEIKGTSQTISTAQAIQRRSAAFPFEIPYRLINMYSAEGDTVLDPFLGTGTTTLACIAANRNSYGVEIDPELVDYARNNIKVGSPGLNNIILNRLNQHRTFIESLPEEKKAKCYRNLPHDFLVKTRQEVAIELSKITNVNISGNIINCEYV
ncbi:MAG: site-specific DNA-methyltransferase [Oscillospiraceae bacterium]|nr:site-specific DNA-methyltransferase [Oscillospiraceae bacterium]